MNKPDTILLSDVTWKEKVQKGEDVQNVGLIKTFIPDELRVEEGPNGLPRVKFVISTDARDRHADTVSVKGWQLDNYLKNPVVLYGHHSAGLPIGQALEVSVNKGKLESVAQFDTDIPEHPLPRAVVALLKRGTLRATSVGFIPQEWKQPDPESLQEYQKMRFPLDFTKQELVEWSVVPVPSNPEALMSAKKAGIDIAPIINWAGEVLDMYGGASKQGLWIPRDVMERVARIGSPAIFSYSQDKGWLMESKSKKDQVQKLRDLQKQLSPEDLASSTNLLEIIENAAETIGSAIDELEVTLGIPQDDSTVDNSLKNKGVSPSSISDAKAPENTPWNGPSLKDFTNKDWSALSSAEKTSIAKHFAWAEEMPPNAYGSLKLPHHSASNGATVWNGVRAAMGALMGARGGVQIPSGDKAAVHAHLAGHYRAFGKEPPAMKEYTEEELQALFFDDATSDDATSDKKEEPMKKEANAGADGIPYSPKDVAFAFDRIQKLEKSPCDQVFLVQDDFAEILSGSFNRTTEKDAWLMVLRPKGENGGFCVPLGEIERNKALDFAMRTIEEDKNKDVEAVLALHYGDDDKKRPVYVEQIKVCRKQVNEKPNPAEKQEPVAGMKDVIEAMAMSLGPAIKKALAEATGRIED